MKKLIMCFLFSCVYLSSLRSEDCFYTSTLNYRHIYEDFSDVFSSIPYKLFVRDKTEENELESIPNIKIWHPFIAECSGKDRVLAHKIYNYLKDSLYFIKKAEWEWGVYRVK